MPHSLYLHSSLAKLRVCRDFSLPLSRGPDDGQSGADAFTNEENTHHEGNSKDNSKDNSTVSINSDFKSSADFSGDETEFPLTPYSGDRPLLSNAERLGHPKSSIQSTLYFAFLDCVVALSFAFIINSSMLIVAASSFWAHGIHDVEELQDAYTLLKTDVGPVAAVIFAISLLVSGQSSSVTGTMAGQVCIHQDLTQHPPGGHGKFFGSTDPTVDSSSGDAALGHCSCSADHLDCW